jgi:predicted RNA-binding protein with PIN domain
VLVFDGWKGGGREARSDAHGPVTVWYTRAGERADAFIVRWVGEHPEAVVVTSDRAVQQGASRRGAAVLDAETFAARLEGEPAPVPARGRPRGSRAAWLRGL